jgi:ABC-type nitrate/sulfonate/bicarbonate transport system substrate-binding protein
VPTLADLKGKKIGAISGTSSAYFVQQMLESPVSAGGVGAKRGEYSVVSGNQCTADPCGSGTLPAMLKAGTVDAVGFWEPSVELAARGIGLDNAVFYQNFTVYREIFNLHTTSEKLADKAKRKEIVEFVRALEMALKVFRESPEKVYKRAADAVGMKEELMKAVWPVHRWTGTLPADLLSVLVEEDGYVAGLDKRGAMSEGVLKGLIDGSVLEEARAGI